MRWDCAIADFDEVIRLEPDSAIAHNNRGEVRFATGLYDEALQDFKKAHDLQPGFDFSVAGMAVTYHALGQIETAANLWKMLMGLDSRYRDVTWAGEHLHWVQSLIDEAQKLATRL